jgi:hypothetical protein
VNPQNIYLPAPTADLSWKYNGRRVLVDTAEGGMLRAESSRRIFRAIYSASPDCGELRGGIQ